MPYYAPTAEEVVHVIQTEGSFKIRQFEVFKVDWYPNMDNESSNRGKSVLQRAYE